MWPGCWREMREGSRPVLKAHHTRRTASLLVLSLVALLAACGQASGLSTNGADIGTKGATPATTATMITPSPTEISLPYSFPKQWLHAPDGADLPQWPSEVGGLVFSPSSPQTGYFCIVSPDHADNSPATPPAVSVTNDGGQSWQPASGSTSRFKTACQMSIDASDPRDIFVSAGNPQTQEQFYRSLDGGATWQTVTLPNLNMGTGIFVAAVAVVQSRLIVDLGLHGEGNLPDPLFASDNGGATWSPIRLFINGQNVHIGGQFWIAGTTLFASAGFGCQGPCGAMQAPLGGGYRTKQLSQPFSSQPPAPNLYFKSTDGGRTWTALATPISNLSNLSVTRSADDSTTYIIGSGPVVPSQGGMNFLGYYSKDGGATWKPLPTFTGVENGYLDPGSFGVYGAYVLPDGSVISTTFHTTGPNNGFDAGAFLLRPSDPSPTWHPLIKSLNGVIAQPVATSTGIRVWGQTIDPQQAGGFLEYFDLP